MTDDISVVIPAYNAEKYLAQAVQSVLDQTLQPLEVIIVDDGSVDRTGQIADSFCSPVRCIRQANQGAGPARNTGAAAARGTYLAFLDADDLWAPDKLAKQVAVLDGDSGLAAVFAHVQQFISPDMDETAAARIVCPESPMPGLHPGTMLIKKSVFGQIGPFSAAYTSGEFLEWFSRAKEADLKYRMLPEILMQRRIHGTNSVLTHENNSAEYLKIIKAALDRRRAAQKEPR